MFRITNRTFVFWTSSKSEATKEAENATFSFFSNTNKEDDPNKRIESVKKVFNSIYSGIKKSDSDDHFYFLGLAPNSAHIAVVYWNEIPLKDFAKKIINHFNDMSIVDARNSPKAYMGIYQILSAVSLKGEVSKIQPSLPEAVIKSILQDIPYPYSLMMACIERIRAEQYIQ